MIGKTLSNRYKILEKIGGGGMAEVFKGKDTLLNRTVTIKILREQYTSDSDFVKRFRREAQAVASLSHPNIVSIYDVGEDGKIHYLVMEYVEGSNLKDLINKEAPLDFERSINIAIQICDALEHAHINGVIHRDIKPHNILITPTGRVKVTDFGIARAVTEATITYTGSMVGSVHYISPEQAKGKITDYKSDIYSAGVVLYEMVTGKVPFTGESPITVALKHIQEELPAVDEINPEAPESLQDIIETAVSKDPDERFSSASEMRDSLVSVLNQIKSKANFGGMEGNNVPKKRKLKPLGWILFIVLILGGLYAVYAALMGYLIVEEVEVPNVVGKSLPEAQRMLKEKNLKFEIVDKRHHRIIEENHVIKQEPAPEEIIKRNRIVELEVSLGPELIKVPDVKGETLRSARIKILNARFLISPNIKEVYNEEVAAGRVISQIPEAGELKPEGTEIALEVSKGAKPEYISMPDLIGLPLAQAEAKLREVRLQLGVVSYQASEEYFTGQVIEQDVSPGEEILQDSTINLVVSKGPGPKPKNAVVKFRINDGEEHLVKIVVEDLKGEHQEYLNKHEPGDFVKVSIPYYGEGIVKVYWDNALVEQKPVS